MQLKQISILEASAISSRQLNLLLHKNVQLEKCIAENNTINEKTIKLNKSTT